jgi:hypothetical protein
MKTAVIKIRNWVKSNGDISTNGKRITYSFAELENAIQLALEKEKAQLLKFWEGGMKCTEEGEQSFDEYYNQNYNQNK